MSEDLSRRDLVALAGAGIVLSGCVPCKSDGVQITSVDDWGENPQDGHPVGGLQHYPSDFKPNYIALLYLGLGSNWQVRVNHASYWMPGKGPDDRRDKAIAVFKALISGPPQHRFGDRGMQIQHQSFQRKDHSLDGVTFDTFRFASATEIFIFIHQADLVPGPTTQTTITLDPRTLLSFGSRLQKKDAHGNPLPAARNYSFFNAAVVNGDADLNKLGGIIRVENWMTEELGDPITAPDISYSMNIHFTIPGNNGRQFPMVFDPDTGNGTGNEP
jgi:hypothetical protein